VDLKSAELLTLQFVGELISSCRILLLRFPKTRRSFTTVKFIR